MDLQLFYLDYNFEVVLEGLEFSVSTCWIVKMARNKGENASVSERKRVIELRQAGKSIREVAQILNRSKRFVTATWAKKEWPHLSDRKQKAKKSKLTVQAKRFITAFVKNKWCRGYRKVTKALNSSGLLPGGVTVSTTTVQRYIQSQVWGKTSYKMQVKPLSHQSRRKGASLRAGIGASMVFLMKPVKENKKG